VEGNLGGGLSEIKVLRRLGPIALLAAQAFVSPAFAEAFAANEAERRTSKTTSLDEVVVVAQGRPQRLQDVPISASVVSGVAVQSWSLNDLQAITASVPGVRISPGPGADFVNIRGVGSGENAGFEQSVSTFVDGTYRGRGRAIRASLFDVEHVEVLKGPQTTFFGNNAIAGAFNIVTRKPARQAEHNASALYAPIDDEYALEAGISKPISPTLSVRLAGKLSGMDGYTRNAVNGRFGPHLRDFIGRASVRWEATPTWELDARVDYGRNRDTEQSQYQLINCPPPPAFGGPIGVCANQLAASGGAIDDRLDYNASVMPSFFDYDFVEASMTNRWKIGSAALKWISTYFRHDFAQMNTVFPVDYPGVADTPFVHNVFNDETVEVFSNELRLEADNGGAVNWMIGAYHSHSELSADLLSGSYFAPLGALGAPYFDADTPFANLGGLEETAKTGSIFASASVSLSGALRFNLGARYSRVSKKTLRSLVFGSAFPAATFDTFIPAPEAVQLQIANGLDAQLGPFDKPKRIDDKLMPSLSIQYDLTPQVMTYLSYTNGSKAGATR
jgi:iron complex outermembrane recepter protein